ncbi:heterokaryon incompatibility protein-domain-containing protein [Podospora didyma]|uniref:Heterokaryon incompatibility protein-domain-containing protein n=1 Tax=Podospora didyma TaxID=330526 RepID=A0AAE0U138_9PEZI|nr:heterokaryon incompatibility protein-domain-containing protein [Podospora didyma]
MRLLDTTSLTLKFFAGGPIPEYAILSHRWEEEEVLFDDIRNGVTQGIEALKGFAKVKQSCDLACREGYHYIWIDTCCIDKASSAELSESINSMFNWYRQAAVCYAYLSDVRKLDWRTSSFSDSQWFTRGWTLQELIAPAVVVFYDSGWDQIGTKSDLCSIIETKTGIPSTVLVRQDYEMAGCSSCNQGALGFVLIGPDVVPCSHNSRQDRELSTVLENCSVAQRLSWASRRNTTRVEDAAYCLLGIFGVNMPLLYGEGLRAFVRLQEEIIKISNDQSILAFARNGPEWPFEGQDSLLAESPHLFAGLGGLAPVAWADNITMTPTLKAIDTKLLMCQLKSSSAPTSVGGPLWLGILHCADFSEPGRLVHSAIILKAVDLEDSVFRRVYSHTIASVEIGTSTVRVTREHIQSLFTYDTEDAVLTNIHLLLVSREPNAEQAAPNSRGVRLLTSFHCNRGGLQCVYSLAGGTTESIMPRDHNNPDTHQIELEYRCNGYELWGVVAALATFHHSQPFWVFHGYRDHKGLSPRSPWCKIVAWPTVLEVGVEMGFLHLDKRPEDIYFSRGEFENAVWENPRAWERLIGLSEGEEPGNESYSLIRRGHEMSLHVTASVTGKEFLKHYPFLDLKITSS